MPIAIGWLGISRLVILSARRSVAGRAGGYSWVMSGNVVTAAELEKMTPAEQKALFDQSVVTDLSQVPDEFLARVRQRLEQHIDRTESAPNQK